MATRRKTVKPESVIRRLQREVRIFEREAEYWKIEANGQQKIVERLHCELSQLQESRKTYANDKFERGLNTIYQLVNASETRLDRIEQSLKPWWKQLWDKWRG